MKSILVLFLVVLFLVLIISMLVGAVMFCIDIWKWSKRPEKFTTVEEDLSKSTDITTHQDDYSELSVNFNENKESEEYQWN